VRFGGTPIARSSEVRSAIVAVNRVGTNLNQLVKLANSGILLPPELLREIHAVRAEIGALRQAFLAALRDEPERKGGA
jgi:mobilization protein MobC